jgi:hypothetical protein
VQFDGEKFFLKILLALICGVAKLSVPIFNTLRTDGNRRIASKAK